LLRVHYVVPERRSVTTPFMEHPTTRPSRACRVGATDKSCQRAGGHGLKQTSPSPGTCSGGCVVNVSAAIARGKRPVPFRTRKLRLSAPMVLQGGPCGRVGHRRTPFREEPLHWRGSSCLTRTSTRQLIRRGASRGPAGPSRAVVSYLALDAPSVRETERLQGDSPTTQQQPARQNEEHLRERPRRRPT
jgi:hypothetical protein